MQKLLLIKNKNRNANLGKSCNANINQNSVRASKASIKNLKCYLSGICMCLNYYESVFVKVETTPSIRGQEAILEINSMSKCLLT